MMVKCALDAKYNRCPDLQPGQICGRKSGRCGMMEPEEVEQPMQREPKWYEEYYTGKSRKNRW